MEQIQNNEKPIYAKAFINGFASTISLWVFWTPFIIFIARPLISAQIKQEVCNFFWYQARSLIDEWNSLVSKYLYELVQNKTITVEEYETLYSELFFSRSEVVPPDVQATLDNSDNANWNENLPLIIFFFVTFLIVIWSCVFIIISLCALYNIDPYEILYFNLFMTLIIILIETVFFSFVAMRYFPYNLSYIVNYVQRDILSIF
jgi:hypothetical protein